MVNNNNESNEKTYRTTAPAMTLEGREDQLASLAMDLVEKRLRKGTATSQEVTALLKAGSTAARLERDILRLNKELISAKTETMRSQQRVEDLYANALSAMKSYSGASNEEEPFDD